MPTPFYLSESRTGLLRKHHIIVSLVINKRPHTFYQTKWWVIGGLKPCFRQDDFIYNRVSLKLLNGQKI